MKRLTCVIVALIAFVAVHAIAQNAEVLAIVGGTIIDGNGGTPIEDGVIVIEGKRIVAVGDRTTPIPPQAKRIAAMGKFIIPGLMDEVFLMGDYAPANTFIRYEGQYDKIAIEGAQIALKYGVTTVFDIWGPRDDLIKARDAINQGRAIGSRIYLAGNVIGYGGPYSEDFLTQRGQEFEVLSSAYKARINSRFAENVGEELTWMSPEQVRQEIRKYIHSGVDYLSVGITSHRYHSGQLFVFSPRVLQVIIEEAHRAGMPVSGFHPLGGEAVVYALNAGVDLLRCDFTMDPISGGGGPLPAETVALLAQRQIPCSIIPISKKNLEWNRQHETDHPMLKFFRALGANDPALIGAGALVYMGSGGQLWGQDSLNSSEVEANGPPDDDPRIMGKSHFLWLRAAVENGMKPMAALMAATRNVAKAYKKDKDLGTLEPGKFGDLVILDKNPLENANNYRSISLVMKEGSIVDRDALPTQRFLTVPAAQN